MRLTRVLTITLTVLFVAGIAGADLKVVLLHHQDGFTMMGQTQPPKDEEHVTWIAAKKMRMDQGASSTVVDLDANKMLMINHEDKSYTEVGLPIDLEALLPPGMGEQMIAMMKFDITVTPSEETKKVGDWTAKRYDMKLTSAMMNMTSVIWASKETPVDFERYYDLYTNVMSLQPGMESMLEEMQKIDGYVVAQEASMSMQFMGDTAVGSSDTVASIESMDPPAGTYDPPTGYTREEFDYMAMLQNR